MKYCCKREDGLLLAVIEDDAGNRLDAEACPSKYASMLRRDEARNAETTTFAALGERPRGHLPHPPAVLDEERADDGHPAGEPIAEDREPSDAGIGEELETEASPPPAAPETPPATEPPAPPAEPAEAPTVPAAA